METPAAEFRYLHEAMGLFGQVTSSCFGYKEDVGVGDWEFWDGIVPVCDDSVLDVDELYG